MHYVNISHNFFTILFSSYYILQYFFTVFLVKGHTDQLGGHQGLPLGSVGPMNPRFS